jgi:hypothetical protein
MFESLENGEKLSRTHLPTIFHWTREIKKLREIIKVIPVVEETATSKLRNGKRKSNEIAASDELSLPF